MFYWRKSFEHLVIGIVCVHLTKATLEGGIASAVGKGRRVDLRIGRLEFGVIEGSSLESTRDSGNI